MSILIDNDTSLERYQNDFFFFEKNKKFRAFVIWSSFFMITNGKTVVYHKEKFKTTKVKGYSLLVEPNFSVLSAHGSFSFLALLF